MPKINQYFCEIKQYLGYNWAKNKNFPALNIERSKRMLMHVHALHGTAPLSREYIIHVYVTGKFNVFMNKSFKT